MWVVKSDACRDDGSVAAQHYTLWLSLNVLSVSCRGWEVLSKTFNSLAVCDFLYKEPENPKLLSKLGINLPHLFKGELTLPVYRESKNTHVVTSAA